MAAIAQRCVSGVFTTAKPNLPGFDRLILDRCEIGVFMGTITKGLVLAQTACTPEIRFA